MHMKYTRLNGTDRKNEIHCMHPVEVKQKTNQSIAIYTRAPASIAKLQKKKNIWHKQLYK